MSRLPRQHLERIRNPSGPPSRDGPASHRARSETFCAISISNLVQQPQQRSRGRLQRKLVGTEHGLKLHDILSVLNRSVQVRRLGARFHIHIHAGSATWTRSRSLPRNAGNNANREVYAKSRVTILRGSRFRAKGWAQSLNLVVAPLPGQVCRVLGAQWQCSCLGFR